MSAPTELLCVVHHMVVNDAFINRREYNPTTGSVEWYRLVNGVKEAPYPKSAEVLELEFQQLRSIGKVDETDISGQ